MGTLGKAIYTVGFWIRETGQALDRVGCRLQGNHPFREQLSRHRALMNVFDKASFVAPSASVIGISVGAGTDVHDNSLVHVAKTNLASKVLPPIIGHNVTVGHSAIFHACTVEDGVYVEKHAMVAAGALVRQNTRVPCGEMRSGFVRGLTTFAAASAPTRRKSIDHDMVKSLMKEGCSEGQAEAIASIIADAISKIEEEKLQNILNKLEDQVKPSKAMLVAVEKKYRLFVDKKKSPWYKFLVFCFFNLAGIIGGAGYFLKYIMK